MSNLKQLYDHYYNKHGHGTGMEIYRALQEYLEMVKTEYPHHQAEIERLTANNILRMHEPINNSLFAILSLELPEMNKLYEMEKERTTLEQGLLYAEHPNKQKRIEYLTKKLQERDKQTRSRYEEEFDIKYPKTDYEAMAKQIKREQERKAGDITNIKDSDIL
jgi:hypothetical protein